MKLSYKQLSGVLVLLLTLGVLTMFGFNKKPKVTETKTFSCPGMEGFTFEYPVSEKWKLNIVPGASDQGGNVCAMYLNNNSPKFNYQDRSGGADISDKTPRILVVKTFFVGLPHSFDLSKTKKNLQGVPYEEVDLKDGTNAITFYGSNFVVKIRSVNVDYKFANSTFFKTVIESFRIIK